MVKKSLIILMLVGLAGCTSRSVSDLNPKTPQVEMQIGQAKLKVEVRVTEAERALGLSYRVSLGENEGMVFKFPTPAQYGFWMKGMNFPLDMIWIRGGKVVDISAGVPAPKTETDTLPVVQPKEPAETVLEVNAGWAEKNNIKVGDLVVL